MLSIQIRKPNLIEDIFYDFVAPNVRDEEFPRANHISQEDLEIFNRKSVVELTALAREVAPDRAVVVEDHRTVPQMWRTSTSVWRTRTCGSAGNVFGLRGHLNCFGEFTRAYKCCGLSARLHRSNCMSVNFHPFGEFFASGSLGTNLKIWDIRNKGCIHTYKGHTRRVNAIRFTPDDCWVVSGSKESALKLESYYMSVIFSGYICILVSFFWQQAFAVLENELLQFPAENNPKQ